MQKYIICHRNLPNFSQFLLNFDDKNCEWTYFPEKARHFSTFNSAYDYKRDMELDDYRMLKRRMVVLQLGNYLSSPEMLKCDASVNALTYI